MKFRAAQLAAQTRSTESRNRRVSSPQAFACRHSAAALALVLLLVALTSFAVEGKAKSLATLQGTLFSVTGTGPVLRAGGKDITLASQNTFLLHTLRDKRLQGRTLRLEGSTKPDGSFDIERIYTIHSGKPYRIRYYCEVCNIEALEPGDCVCCQKPTELQEIPVEGGAYKQIMVTP